MRATANDDGRFLYNLVHSVNDRQLFFIFWAVIVTLFCWLMYSGYRKSQRRNFRSSEDGSGPTVRVDARQLKDGGNLPNKK